MVVNAMVLSAPPGHAWASAAGASAALDNGLVLLILGVAAIIAAGGLIALDFFFPEFGIADYTLIAPLLYFGFGALSLGAIVYTANALFQPQPIGQTTGADGTKCSTYSSPFGGCFSVCVHPDGTGSTTSCGGGLGGFLVDLGIGIAVIGAAGLGTYATYRYLKSRPARAPGTPPPPPRQGLIPRTYRRAKEYLIG